MTATKLERVDKPARLLIDGRLLVERVMWNRIDATCRGDSGEVYRLSYMDGRWTCDCEARGDCSHLRALWLVTVKPRA